MKYSVDTSAILDGWRRNYSPDVFPGFWDRLDALISEGSLRATDEVLVELERKDDEVYAWARKRTDLFVPIDSDIQIAVTDILSSYEKLLDTRANRSSADPFVIALAKTNKCAVVTAERATNSPLRPNIPDVCNALGVPVMTLLQLARGEGWRF